MSDGYLNYSDAGVDWLGAVPSHWGVVPLKAVISCNDEVLGEEVSDDFQIAYVEISGVTAGLGITDISEMSFSEAPSRARRKVQHGDVLVSTVRTYLRAISPVINPPSNLVVSTGFAVLRPRQLGSGYLGYLVQAEFFISSVIASSVGVSYPAINASDLIRIFIPLPPLPEQTTIAAFLDRETAKIDALVEEQKRLIALLQEKRQAVISHAVTKGLNPDAPMKDSGVEWLGEVPAHWEVKPLRFLISSISSGTSVNSIDTPAIEGEFGVLKTSCVYTGEFDPNENKAVIVEEYDRLACPVKASTLIVSRMNTPELVGAAGWVRMDNPNLFLPDRLWQIEFTDSDPAYLHLWTLTRNYRAQVEVACAGTSSSMQNLSQDQLKSFVLAVPPHEEQRSISTFLSAEIQKLGALANEARQAICLLQERRSALISAAVTGKIDVRGFVDTLEAAQ